MVAEGRGPWRRLDVLVKGQQGGDLCGDGTVRELIMSM